MCKAQVLLHYYVIAAAITPLAEALVQFTMRPSDPSYVNNGSTAKLVWDYSDPQKQLQGIVFSVLTKSDSSNLRFFNMVAKQNGVVQVSPDIPSAYIGRVSIEGNATLVIEKITPKDSTQIKCKLVASVDHESIIQLIVADAPQIRLSSVQEIYLEGSFVNISCTASGKQETDVTWVRNGRVKSSEKKVAFLIFNSISRTDDGLYICRANNSAQITINRITLAVHYKPEGVTLTTSAVKNTVTQGDTVTFTCGVTAAKPPVSQYRFYLNDSLFKASNDSQYTINNVNRSQHCGEYKCVPRNDAGNGTEATVTLNVNVPVHFTVLSQNMTVNETNLISLSCDALGFPAPSITWTKSGQVLSDKKQLNIPRSDKSDAGEYMCTASNGVGQPKTAKAYVTVQYPPTIQLITASTRKSWIGQTVTLKCVSDGVPTPTLTWYKPDGSEISRVKAHENTIQVKMEVDHDFGDYKCSAAKGLPPSYQRIITIKQITSEHMEVHLTATVNESCSRRLQVAAKFPDKACKLVVHFGCLAALTVDSRCGSVVVDFIMYFNQSVPVSDVLTSLKDAARQDKSL